MIKKVINISGDYTLLGYGMSRTSLFHYKMSLEGASISKVSRLIAEHKRTGRLKKTEYRRHRFPRKYTPSEVGLLARKDELHGWLSGPATKRELLDKLQVQVVVFYNRIEIKALFPIEPIYCHKCTPPCQGEGDTGDRDTKQSLKLEIKPACCLPLPGLSL